MGRIHVKDVEAVAQFASGFSTRVEALTAIAAEALVEVAEACAWMENTINSAEGELQKAREHLEDCHDALRECEAQEDDDYDPDCTAEESAFQDAKDELRMWKIRVRRLKELAARLDRRRRHVLTEVSNLKNRLNQTAGGGRAFLVEQLNLMNDLLRTKFPSS